MKRIVYQRDIDPGDRVVLEVPWGDHSGFIPPPKITFFYEGRDINFIYQGDQS